METRIGRLSETPTQTGLPATVANPIRPEWYAGRSEARLGTSVGVEQFGVNHVILQPGARSALRHWHEEEDEFVFVLFGALTLIDENGEHSLTAGDYVGFPAGVANAHHLANFSPAPAAFIAVGARKVGREVAHYPEAFDGAPQVVTRDERGRRIPNPGA